jgi:hypothetical protein
VWILMDWKPIGGRGRLPSAAIWIALIPLTIFLLLAWLLPSDASYRDWPFAGTVRVVVDLVPAINKFAAISHFPNVTVFVLAVAWLFGIASIPYFAFWLRAPLDRALVIPVRRKLWIVAASLFVICMGWFVAYIGYVPDLQAPRHSAYRSFLIATGQSRTMLAVLGLVIYSYIAASSAIAGSMARNIRKLAP